MTSEGRGRRALGLAGALLLGVAVGTAALMVHREGVWVLLLAVTASLSTALWLRSGGQPASAAAYSLGWVVMLGLAMLGRPEGDWAVAGDVAGYTVMGTGLLLVVVGVTAVGPRRRPAAS